MLAGRAAAWRTCTAVAGALLRPQLTCKASVVLHQPAYHSTLADAFASTSAVRSFRAGCDLRQPSASLAARCAQARPAQPPQASLLPQLRVAQRWASTDSRRPLQAARDAVLKRLPKGVRSSAALTSTAPALLREQAHVCLWRRAAGQPRRSAPEGRARACTWRCPAAGAAAGGGARRARRGAEGALAAPGRLLAAPRAQGHRRRGRRRRLLPVVRPRPAPAAGSARERARAVHGSGRHGALLAAPASCLARLQRLERTARLCKISCIPRGCAALDTYLSCAVYPLPTRNASSRTRPPPQRRHTS